MQFRLSVANRHEEPVVQIANLRLRGFLREREDSNIEHGYSSSPAVLPFGVLDGLPGGHVPTKVRVSPAWKSTELGSQG
jgi:hypothetical protein